MQMSGCMLQSNNSILASMYLQCYCVARKTDKELIQDYCNVYTKLYVIKKPQRALQPSKNSLSSKFSILVLNAEFQRRLEVITHVQCTFEKVSHEKSCEPIGCNKNCTDGV